MNENNENNSDVVRPYKATANLNTTIGNPSVNINDTMNVNIQSMVTNTTQPVQSNFSVSNNIQSNLSNINDNSVVDVDIKKNTGLNNLNDVNSLNQNNIQEASYVTKTYVSVDNKPKKKKVTLNFGSEFKVALLIIVILLVFVFMLPIISEIVFGY